MRAHNPSPTLAQQFAELAETSEALIQKALKSGNVGASERVPQAHDLNPWDSTTAYGDTYRTTEHEGTLGLDYDVLLRMSRVPVISAIIQTRVNQIAEFCNPQRDKYSAGYILEPREPDTEITDAIRKRMNDLTRWLETCGDGYKLGGASDFEAFVRMILRDSLTYDQCVFEILKNRKGEISGFVPVDASTIRRSATTDEEKKEGRRDWQESAFVQVINVALF